MEKVEGYEKTVHGRRVRVHGYFRKVRNHITGHDRSVDRRNARKARRERARR